MKSKLYLFSQIIPTILWNNGCKFYSNKSGNIQDITSNTFTDATICVQFKNNDYKNCSIGFRDNINNSWVLINKAIIINGIKQEFEFCEFSNDLLKLSFNAGVIKFQIGYQLNDYQYNMKVNKVQLIANLCNNAECSII